MPTWLSTNRRLVILGAVTFLSFAYFYGAGGWNQNTRFDLVRAIVEQRTIRIDAYHENSGDKAPFGGHVYADKAPGASFTAVPAVALVRAVAIAGGVAGESRDLIIWLSYVATVAAGALPAAIACLCLYGLARRLGASEGLATIAALIYGLGTPLWAYATLFWGHALTAACLIVALYAADLLRDDPDNRRRDMLLGGVVGLAAGWAVVTEFPAAIPALFLALLTLRLVWASGTSRVVRVGAAVATTAGLCAIALGAYQWAAFGSPFHVGYASEESPELLQAGFFGITLPKLDVMGELLWGSYRGLLPLAPALVVAPIGWWMARRSEMKWTIGAAVVCGLFYFLLNSAYEHWEGGWSYGPRHLGAVLGFFALGLVPVLTRGGAIARAIVIALGLFGVGSALVAVSTTAQPPSMQYDHPMQQLMWPDFVAGRFSQNPQSILDPLWRPDAGNAAFNLGEKIGLSGHSSLIPLLLLWVGAGVLWRASGQAQEPSTAAPASRKPGKRRRRR
jgi:hypothetical protein